MAKLVVWLCRLMVVTIAARVFLYSLHHSQEELTTQIEHERFVCGKHKTGVKVVKAESLDDGRPVPAGCVSTSGKKWNAGGDSFKMCLHPPPDVISDKIRAVGMWERVFIDRFKGQIARLGANGLVIDIGANLGEYGLLAAQMGRHAIMIEPMNTNANRIEASIGANNWERDPTRRDHIRVVRGAVGCSEFLRLSVNPTNKGGSSTTVQPISSSSKAGNEIADYLKTADMALDHSFVHCVALDSFDELELIPPTAMKDGMLLKVGNVNRYFSH